MARSNPPPGVVNVIILATVVGVVALMVNTVFLPILWNEIASTWNEFDVEMRNVKDLCDNLWGDIGKLRVRPTRERRESVRRTLEKFDGEQPDVNQGNIEYSSELGQDGRQGQEQTEDYENEVRRAPTQSPTTDDDTEEDMTVMPRCDCKPDTCPKGPPGPQGHPGYAGVPGTPGPDGIPGKDASEIVASPTGPGRCFRCPAGPEGPPGLPGAMGMRGLRGVEGRPGCFGRNGQAGVPGSMGEPGQMGPPGPIGPPGPVGRPARVAKGSRGPKGVPGPLGGGGHVGDRGEPGQPGINGNTGPQGPPGRRGRPGKRGEEGYTGEPGERGDQGEYCLCPKAKPPSTAPQPPAPTMEALIPLKNTGAYPLPKAFNESHGRAPPEKEKEPTTTPIAVDPSGYEVDNKMIENVAKMMEEHENAVMETRRANPSKVEVMPAIMPHTPPPTSPPAFVPPHHEPESPSKDGYEIYTGLREQKHEESKEIVGGGDKLTQSTVKPTIGMFRTIGPKSGGASNHSTPLSAIAESADESESTDSAAIPKEIFRKSFRKISKAPRIHHSRVAAPETSPLPVFVPIRFPKTILNRGVFNAKTASAKPTRVTNDEIPADIFSVHN